MRIHGTFGWQRIAASLLLCAAAISVATPSLLHAVSAGVGRRFVGIAEIDPLTAVIGSTEIRSYPSMEAERGSIEIRDASTMAVLGTGKTGKNGEYVITLSAPLVAGQIIQAFNVTRDYCSSGVKVPNDPPGVGESLPAPVIDEPLLFGATSIKGRGVPGHTIALINAVDGSIVTQTAAPLPMTGGGAFSFSVPPLPPFRIFKVMDVQSGAMSKSVPVLGKPSRGKVPRNPCKMKGGNQNVGPLTVTLYDCDLQNPRGIAVGPDQKVYVTAGAPPSDLVNTAPAGVFRLDPGTGALELFSAVHGVGLRFAPPTALGLNQDLFLARPRLFMILGRMVVDRNDGELFRIDRGTGEAQVAHRLLDNSPTGIGFDTTPGQAFYGDLMVTSFLGDKLQTIDEMYGSPGATLNGVVGLWGLAFGDGGAFGSDAFASQPAGGKVLRITNNLGVLAQQDFATGLVSPTDIAFGPGGVFGNNLYVADPGAGEIVRLDPTGARSTFGSEFFRPFGIAFDPATQSMYITDFESGDILRIQ